MNRPFLAVAILAGLTLAGCGSGTDGNSAAPAAKLDSVTAPAGSKWTETVTVTPDGGVAMGNPDAAVKVIEFGSFSCPHCRDFSAESAEERNAMVETGRLSFEYRTFVRDPIDMTLALLSHCGGAEPFFPLSEQFFAAQDSIMTKAQGMGQDAYAAVVGKPLDQRFSALADALGLIDFVKQRGLSEQKARQCLSDQAMVEKLVKNVQVDTEKYKIEGTPTLVMNGTVVENAASWSVMRAKLKEAGL